MFCGVTLCVKKLSLNFAPYGVLLSRLLTTTLEEPTSKILMYIYMH